MPVSRAWYNTLVDDDGSGLTGTIWNKNSVNILLGLIDARVADWIDLPYNGANYIASGATWTVDAGDLVLNRYCVLGNAMMWCVQIAASSLSGPSPTLYLASPRVLANTHNFSPSAYPAGLLVVPFSSALLSVSLAGGGNFAGSTNGLYVYFTWIGEIG